MLTAIGIVMTAFGAAFAVAHHQQYKRNKMIDDLHATCDAISKISKEIMHL